MKAEQEPRRIDIFMNGMRIGARYFGLGLPKPLPTKDAPTFDVRLRDREIEVLCGYCGQASMKVFNIPGKPPLYSATMKMNFSE
jgi:hypothetical protein